MNVYDKDNGCCFASINNAFINMLLLLCYYGLYHIIVLAVIYIVYQQHPFISDPVLGAITTISNVENMHHTISVLPTNNHGITASTITDEQMHMPPPPLPSPSHGPTTLNSNVTAMRSLKRLSLSFPIQPVDRDSQRRFSTITLSPDRDSSPSSPELRPSTSTDSDTFLTTLAAQERHVLELKEELQKAEADLDRLKKHWAANEATKKRNEMRHVEQLRLLPIPSPSKTATEVIDGERRSSREEEQKKASKVRPKQVHRKVFEGGKHTRALSLLSPATMMKAVSTPSGAASAAVPFNSMGTKDDIVNTGKQLVGDLKEGLWTFIEDIRQATVGDEAIKSGRPRHKRNHSLGRSPARSNSRSRADVTPTRNILPPRPKARLSQSPDSQLESSDILIDVDGNSIFNTSASEKLTSSASSPLHCVSKQTVADIYVDDEGWDNWDSPDAKLPLLL